MKLAIGDGVARRPPVVREGPVVLDQPAKLRGHLAWWKKQGVEGLVFYDVYPDFYRRSREHFQALKAVLDEVELPVGGFNALRKSLFVPELTERDEQRLYQCLDAATVLGAEIFDVSVNVPLPTQRDAHSLATRPIFLGWVCNEGGVGCWVRVVSDLPDTRHPTPDT